MRLHVSVFLALAWLGLGMLVRNPDEDMPLSMGLEGNPEEGSPVSAGLDDDDWSADFVRKRSVASGSCRTNWTVPDVRLAIRNVRARCGFARCHANLSEAPVIPRILHYTQCCQNRSRWHPRHRWFEGLAQSRFFGPDWTLQFWDDRALRSFMRKIVPTVEAIAWFADVWEQLPYKIQRIDAARYCWLYVYGGVYSDMDVTMKDTVNASQFLAGGRRLVLMDFSDRASKEDAGACGPHLGNWFMASVKEHPLWIQVLRQIEEQVLRPQSGPDRERVLLTTGPYALGSALVAWMRSVPSCREERLLLVNIYNHCGINQYSTYSWRGQWETERPAAPQGGDPRPAARHEVAAAAGAA